MSGGDAEYSHLFYSPGFKNLPGAEPRGPALAVRKHLSTLGATVESWLLTDDRVAWERAAIANDAPPSADQVAATGL